jgi:hypothetical protein
MSGLRTVPGMTENMTSAEHIVLTRSQVAARYGCAERTAYRRMSGDSFGVTSRAELIAMDLPE